MLGIDKGRNVVSLAYRCVCASLDVAAFAPVVENFVNLAEYWGEEIRKPVDGDTPSKPTDLPVHSIQV